MKFQNIIKLSLVASIFFAASQIPTGTLFAGSGSSEENDFVLEPQSQEGMLGEVKLFAGNFAPRTWMECNGQLLSIASNQALFSILGTMYGGDGRTTFALPDLRGRTAVGVGYGPGLADVNQGQKWGSNQATLNVTNLPSHTHNATVSLNAASVVGETTPSATGNVLSSRGRGGAAQSSIYTDAANSTTLRADAASATISNTGSNQPFNITQPSLGMRYIICVNGTFPSRN